VQVKPTQNEHRHNRNDKVLKLLSAQPAPTVN